MANCRRCPFALALQLFLTGMLPDTVVVVA